jgi:5-(aminomethyl)-3-furanmethanol phosphate kinase
VRYDHSRDRISAMDSVFNPTEAAPAIKAGACVIQIGGNLADWVAMADWLNLAGRLAARVPTVIVPTGGPFAETVREAEDMWRLSPTIVRRMMLLGMDSHALLLHGIRPDIVATAADFAAIWANAAADQASVWMPGGLARERADLVNDWDMSSDSLAAWLAVELGAERLILVNSGACPCHAVDTLARVRDGLLGPDFPGWRRRFRGKVWCVGRDQVEELAAALDRDEEFGCPLASVPSLMAERP